MAEQTSEDRKQGTYKTNLWQKAKDKQSVLVLFEKIVLDDTRRHAREIGIWNILNGDSLTSITTFRKRTQIKIMVRTITIDR